MCDMIRHSTKMHRSIKRGERKNIGNYGNKADHHYHLFTFIIYILCTLDWHLSSIITIFLYILASFIWINLQNAFTFGAILWPNLLFFYDHFLKEDINKAGSCTSSYPTRIFQWCGTGITMVYFDIVLEISCLLRVGVRNLVFSWILYAFSESWWYINMAIVGEAHAQ